MTMWLPTAVYERIPQFWFVLGVLFVLGGLYLGVGDTTSHAYIAIGFACCASGTAVVIVRARHRKQNSTRDNSTN